MTMRPQSLSSLSTSAVGIATRGRPAILKETLAELRKQTEQPGSVLVAYADASDIGDSESLFPEVRFLKSEPGLTSQRNTILNHTDDFDSVTFLDDDFFPAPNFLAIMNEVLRCEPSIVVATGNVLADGIHGPGLDLQEARSILESSHAWNGVPRLTNVFNAYGCNMTLRMEPIRRNKLRFDQRLPLYGWYEDVDFSRQLASFGRIVKVEQACGVHLGVKSGRQSGLRLGYSQVANPIYLARKKSVSWTYAVSSMTSRTLKNLVFSLRPEPLIDRRGRLKGNACAWSDLFQGRVDPTRILEL